MIERAKVDGLLRQLAVARVALGTASLLVPGLAAKSMGLGGGHDGGRDYVTRMFAAREIALGAGYLLTRGATRSTLVRLGLAVDTLDTVSGMKSRGAVSLWVTAGGTAVSAGAAAIGAAGVVVRDSGSDQED
jgi:hypothetical protein